MYIWDLRLFGQKLIFAAQFVPPSGKCLLNTLRNEQNNEHAPWNFDFSDISPSSTSQVSGAMPDSGE